MLGPTVVEEFDKTKLVAVAAVLVEELSAGEEDVNEVGREIGWGMVVQT